MTGDLAAFLAARLDEDEAMAAEWAEPGRIIHWPWLETRVLREVAAKRKLMTDIAEWLDSDEDEQWYNRGVGEQPPYEGSPRLLKILAAVYGDHPDYRPEWNLEQRRA